MVIERVLVAISGGSKEGKNMGGRGRGKTLWRPKGFRSPHRHDDQKHFNCHAIVAIENFSVTITRGDQKPFGHHMQWQPKGFQLP
jgi:hypothetical protein